MKIPKAESDELKRKYLPIVMKLVCFSAASRMNGSSERFAPYNEAVTELETLFVPLLEEGRQQELADKIRSAFQLAELIGTSDELGLVN